MNKWLKLTLNTIIILALGFSAGGKSSINYNFFVPFVKADDFLAQENAGNISTKILPSDTHGRANWIYQTKDYDMKIRAGYSTIGYMFLTMEIYNKSKNTIELRASSFIVKTDQKYVLKYLPPTEILASLENQGNVAINTAVAAANRAQQAYDNAPVKAVTNTKSSSYGTSHGTGYTTGYAVGNRVNVESNYSGNYYGSTSGTSETTVYKDTSEAAWVGVFSLMEQNKQKKIVSALSGEYQNIKNNSLPEVIFIAPDTRIQGIYTFRMGPFEYISVSNDDLSLYISFIK
ncbi:MAG: hypothetical protein LBQ83_06450 [Candidatus Margulisbacteria bacterium]|jgi:hypothetical protein|nr:hypothetical protein [Candidatus Margulisiibacteriota bacterium]